MSDKKIGIYGKYTDVRRSAASTTMQQAASAAAQGGFGELPHGMTPTELERLRAKFDSFMPNISSKTASAQSFFDGLMPDGGSLAPNAGAGIRSAQMKQRRANFPGGLGSGTSTDGLMTTPSQPIMPEFSCGIGSTPVLLADASTKPLQDVRAGDRVIDRLGSIQTVEKQWCSGVPDELIEIKTWSSKVFKFTTYHSWPVWAWKRDCCCGCGEAVRPGKLYVANHYKAGRYDAVPSKVIRDSQGAPLQRIPENYEPLQRLRADQIRPGDFLLMPRKFDPIKTDVTEADARLLGYYVAEGSVQRYNGALYSADFAFGLSEQDTWCRDVRMLLAERKISSTLKLDEKENGATVSTKNDWGKNREEVQSFVSWLLEHGGEFSETKRLSEEVMRWSVKLKREFIRGLFRGDGHQQWRISVKQGYRGCTFGVHHTTVSGVLSSQVQLILGQLGIPCRQVVGKKSERVIAKNGKKSQCRAPYILSVPAPFAQELADEIWGDQSIARQYPHQSRKGWAAPRPDCMIDDDYIYIPVKAIKRIKNTEPVYNLTVSGDHSYLVNNIATYNSPERQSFPIHKALANRYWRMFYKLDPTIGTCIDLYSELPWGNFELSGEGVDGEVKDSFEYMCNHVELRSFLPFMLREFLVTGEAIPHAFFDDDKGIWAHLSLHNPDHIEVVDAPFLNMDPYLEFVPDSKLRDVLTQDNPIVNRLRESMPPDLLASLLARENIGLNPINCAFIPRKQHFYDTRGTSIISRLWRILSYEDAIFSASIQTARRMAAPLKVAKIGDPATHWIPGPEHEQRLLQLIAQAELDPGAWLTFHYAISFELVGVQERVLKIDSQSEVIERQKLIALGISQAFLTGEITYASASAGLTVFLRRLKALRDMFESKWLYPKFFRQVSEMNSWVKPTPAELSHKVRVRRSHKELLEDKRYIVPKIEWDRSLDPSVDMEMINAMEALNRLGITFSKTTLTSTVNRDFETETKQRVKDLELEQKVLKDHPELFQMAPGGPGGGGGGGGLGMGGGPPPVLPGLPEGTFDGFGGPGGGEGELPPGGEPGGGGVGEVPPGAPPEPAGASLQAADDGGDNAKPNGHKSLDKGALQAAKDLIDVVDGAVPEHELWERALRQPDLQAAFDGGNSHEIWGLVQDWLIDEDYPSGFILDLETALRQKGWLKSPSYDGPTVPSDDEPDLFTGAS